MKEMLEMFVFMGYDLENCHINKHGELMRISEMTNAHLINCIRCCKTDYAPEAYWQSRLPKFAAELMRRA